MGTAELGKALDRAHLLEKAMRKAEKITLKMREAAETKEAEARRQAVQTEKSGERIQDLTNLLVSCSIKVDATVELMQSCGKTFPQADRVVGLLSDLQDRLRAQLGYSLRKGVFSAPTQASPPASRFVEVGVNTDGRTSANQPSVATSHMSLVDTGTMTARTDTRDRKTQVCPPATISQSAQTSNMHVVYSAYKTVSSDLAIDVSQNPSVAPSHVSTGVRNTPPTMVRSNQTERVEAGNNEEKIMMRMTITEPRLQLAVRTLGAGKVSSGAKDSTNRRSLLRPSLSPEKAPLRKNASAPTIRRSTRRSRVGGREPAAETRCPTSRRPGRRKNHANIYNVLPTSKSRREEDLLAPISRPKTAPRKCHTSLSRPKLGS